MLGPLVHPSCSARPRNSLYPTLCNSLFINKWKYVYFLSSFPLTKLSLPKCHFYFVTKLSWPNSLTRLSLLWRYQNLNTELSLPNCQFSELTKLSAYQKASLPNCHYQIVITKLSLPKCHYLIVIIKLSLPNCHYRKSAHRKGSIGRVKALDPLVRQ